MCRCEDGGLPPDARRRVHSQTRQRSRSHRTIATGHHNGLKGCPGKIPIIQTRTKSHRPETTARSCLHQHQHPRGGSVSSGPRGIRQSFVPRHEGTFRSWCGGRVGAAPVTKQSPGTWLFAVVFPQLMRSRLVSIKVR